MRNSPKFSAKHLKVSSRHLRVIDSLLIAGIRIGPLAKRRAIDKILEVVPQLTRGDCWQRIRYLRKTPALAVIGTAQPANEASKLGRNVRKQRSGARPWTEDDDDKLLAYAGYERIERIAQRLDRSEKAVRVRLGALGMSAKLKDGWSLRSLQNMLRTSAPQLRRLIGTGLLRVRDPRVSVRSMHLFWQKNSVLFQNEANERIAASLQEEDEGYKWERLANLLGVTVADVQNWICRGQLKVIDTFVSERAFEDFCHQHGDQINKALIDAEEVKWLIEEYGLPAGVPDKTAIPRAQKHALTMRTCMCGRKIAGNVFFKHIKSCAAKTKAARKESYGANSPPST